MAPEKFPLSSNLPSSLKEELQMTPNCEEQWLHWRTPQPAGEMSWQESHGGHPRPFDDLQPLFISIKNGVNEIYCCGKK